MAPKEEKKKSSAAAKISEKNLNKRKREDSDFSVVESKKESYVERHPKSKYCILHGKRNHSTDSYWDLFAMINKHKQKKGISRPTEIVIRS